LRSIASLEVGICAAVEGGCHYLCLSVYAAFEGGGGGKLSRKKGVVVVGSSCLVVKVVVLFQGDR